MLLHWKGYLVVQEIVKNKVHTGWVWQFLLRKNLRNILIPKIHHKSTLQISGPKNLGENSGNFGKALWNSVELSGFSTALTMNSWEFMGDFGATPGFLGKSGLGWFQAIWGIEKLLSK